MKASPLQLEDIQLTTEEATLLKSALVHTVLSIVVNYGSEDFRKWQKDVQDLRPQSSDVIDVHRTSIHPLPSMEIDESTITGNVEIVEAINAELHIVQNEGEDPKYVQIIAGDQLTIARQRSILNIRIGHENSTDSWKHIVLMPGLFHAKIADCHGLLTTHFGVSSIQSPGSLAFHNTCLDRIPIVLTSLPSFRVSRDLIMVSLYARVLHCLLLVSGAESIEEYTDMFTSLDDLQKHSQEIFNVYADADHVEELREPRQIAELERLDRIKLQQEHDALKARTNKQALRAATTLMDPPIAANTSAIPAPIPASATAPIPTPVPVPASPIDVEELPIDQRGDEVLENGKLFIRDALFTRLFADAIKSGDSGMVILVLKIWSAAFRGSGRSKYAHEMLHLFHNLVNIWSKELRSVYIFSDQSYGLPHRTTRNIITQNWVLNPTGKENAFVEIDLVQEHLNFWIKVRKLRVSEPITTINFTGQKIYKADGDAHSWDWLALVSPCIDILRRLANRLNGELGSKQGTRHSAPDLSKDIERLMSVLKEHGVYTLTPGRVVHSKDAPVPDILSTGMSALAHGTSGNPIADFNEQYNRLCQRRRLTPISENLHPAVHSTTTPTTQFAQERAPFVTIDKDLDELDEAGQSDSENEGDSDEEESGGHSPTLTRTEEGDVALDMDTLELDTASEDEYESDVSEEM